MAAFLTAKHNGDARAAKEEMQQKNAHLLGPDHDLPSLRFFKRQATKMLEHHTVEDLVNILHLHNNVMSLCPCICCPASSISNTLSYQIVHRS